MIDLMSIYKMMDDGKNEEALEIAVQVIAKLDKKSDEYLSLLNALGYIYCNLEEYYKAVNIYSEYIEISRLNSNSENLHIGYHQMAMVLRLDRQYREALDYIIKEKEIIKEYFNNDCLKLSVNEYEYGYILYLTDNFEEAAAHMKRCLDYALKTDDLIAKACAYRGLAEIYGKTDDRKQANDCFDKAYELFLKAEDTVGAEEINIIRNNVLS